MRSIDDVRRFLSPDLGFPANTEVDVPNASLFTRIVYRHSAVPATKTKRHLWVSFRFT
jgi:hypothetical protein